MALDRKVETGHRGEDAAMTGHANRDAAGCDGAAIGLHTDDPVALQVEDADFAVLDQVHAHLVRLAGEGPGDIVMLGDSAAALQRATQNGVTHVGRGIHDRAEGLNLLRRQPLGIDAAQAVGIDAPPTFAHVAEAMDEIEDATLAEEDVVVELLGQSFPELQRMLIDRGALIPEVVGADDSGVASHVAARQPAPFQHRHVGDAMILGQVVGRRQAVAAGPHDDDVVRPLRFGIAPEMFRVRVRFGHPLLAHIYKVWASRLQIGGGPGSDLATSRYTTRRWASARRSRSIGSKPCSSCDRPCGSWTCHAARVGMRSSWRGAAMTSPASTCRPISSMWRRPGRKPRASRFAGWRVTCAGRYLVRPLISC